jgi:hypothetical protein
MPQRPAVHVWTQVAPVAGRHHGHPSLGGLGAHHDRSALTSSWNRVAADSLMASVGHVAQGSQTFPSVTKAQSEMVLHEWSYFFASMTGSQALATSASARVQDRIRPPIRAAQRFICENAARSPS